jgi:hypothetical protein
MIQHLLNSPTAIGTFAAAMGVVTCAYLAFGNRRYYVGSPRSMVLGYRIAWLTAAAAWAARGVQLVLGIDDRPGALAAPATMVAAALVGLYFTIQMRRYAGRGR